MRCASRLARARYLGCSMPQGIILSIQVDGLLFLQNYPVFLLFFFVHFHIFQPLHVEIRRCPLHKSSRQLALATKVAIPTRKKKTTGWRLAYQQGRSRGDGPRNQEPEGLGAQQLVSQVGKRKAQRRGGNFKVTLVVSSNTDKAGEIPISKGFCLFFLGLT